MTYEESSNLAISEQISMLEVERYLGIIVPQIERRLQELARSNLIFSILQVRQTLFLKE